MPTLRPAARLAVVVLAVAALVTLPFFLFSDEFARLFAGDDVLHWLRSYGAAAWLVAAGLLVADIFMPVPTTSVMAALGMIYGPIVGGVAAAAGSILSGLVAYGLCRLLGRPIALWLNGKAALRYGESLFEKAGGWMVAISRWAPVLSEVVACIAGLSHMPFRLFVAALCCGSIPLGFVFAWVGDAGADYPVATLVASALVPAALWSAYVLLTNSGRRE